MIDESSFPRYLTSFHPKAVTHLFTDVLVIGGGLAGLRAALEVNPPLQVLVVTKDALDESASAYAQGGIASVLDPGDHFESHIDDTIDAGKGLCDSDVVEMVVREGPARIQELVEWGTQFDKAGDRLALTREGGHSVARIVHALGDATGREVMRAVTKKARETENIQIWERSFTIDLLSSANRCHGALIWHPERGTTIVWAKQTILATGGAGQLFRETTNPPIATGDGMAIGFRAGAILRDMEFMQFHPTVLYIAGAARHLITEAVRGEGAYLRDCNGVRFMGEFDSREELAPRDVVSRAIAVQMSRTQHSHVYLDLTHLEAAHTRARFPGIDRMCRSFGLDITSDRIPVRPGAHYMIGGVQIDTEGRTSVERLWACGEVSSSGLHGANRLASNSLLEGLVFGVHCGAGAAANANRIDDSYTALPLSSPPQQSEPERYNLVDLRNSLSSLMWRHAGIERTEDGLREAANKIGFWANYALKAQFKSSSGWELQNMLTLAACIVEGALSRNETRGVHFRLDYPNPDDQWKRHFNIQRQVTRD